MEDHNSASLGYNTVESSSTSTPTDNYYNFEIQGPLQINISGAYIAGKKGLISAEYDFSNYENMLLMDEDGNSQNYNAENQRMSSNINNGHTLKLGGEYKLTDNVSLRAGYAITGNTTKSDATKIMYESTTHTDTEYYLNNGITYLTAGIGYREASWFFDLAYVHKKLDETYVPYLNIGNTQASLITKTNNLLFTLGFKF
jgi:long-subunit fatty acid transport protein